MDVVILVFVGVMCAYAAVSILNSKERNRIFNSRPIEVEDVKKYNRFCGFLVIGFGVVAEITIFIAVAFGGIVSMICTVAIVVEAFIVMKIYSKNEVKMLKKR